MATARKGGRVQSKIQMLLFGKQGCGKSTIASQFLYMKRPDGKPFRVLFLDGESGSIDDMLEDIEGDGIDLENLYIVYSQSLKEVNEYIKKATEKEPFYELDDEGNESDDMVLDADGEQFVPDAIVVDGTTVLNLSVKQGLIEFSKRRAKVKADAANLLGDEKFIKVEGAGLEIKDYGTVNFKGQDLVLTLTGSGLHYIITARETDEKESFKTPDNQFTSVATGEKIAEGFKEMGYNVKTEMRLYRDKDDPSTVKAYVVKDRTKTFENGTVVEDPSLLSFQSVIDKTKGNKEIVVKNRLHDAIKEELKQTEHEVMGISAQEVIVESKEQDDNNDLKLAINKKMKALSTAEKEAAKKGLKKEGLPFTPSGIKALEDVKLLEKVLEIIG